MLDPSETKASEYHSHAKKHKKLVDMNLRTSNFQDYLKSNLSCLLHQARKFSNMQKCLKFPTNNININSSIALFQLPKKQSTFKWGYGVPKKQNHQIMGIKDSCKQNIFQQKKLKNHMYQCDNNTLHLQEQKFSKLREKKKEEELVKTRHIIYILNIFIYKLNNKNTHKTSQFLFKTPQKKDLKRQYTIIMIIVTHLQLICIAIFLIDFKNWINLLL